MPVVERFLTGAPCWLDLATSDMAKAKAFYGEIFGWEFRDAGEEYGGYQMISKDGKAVAGAMTNQSPGEQPDGWGIYLSVSDVAETSSRIKESGGAVVLEPMPVGTLGSMMLATDPAGAFIGAWEKREFAGFEVAGDHGTPFWFETLSKSYQESIDFYQKAFGWTTAVRSDTREFRYTTLGEGERAVAGIMDASGSFPDEMPSHWHLYLGVDDIDAAVEGAIQFGGRTMRPVEDTPFGRLTQISDPTGAMLSIAARAH